MLVFSYKLFVYFVEELASCLFSVEKPSAFGDFIIFKLKKAVLLTFLFFNLYHWLKQHAWNEFPVYVPSVSTNLNFWGVSVETVFFTNFGILVRGKFLSPKL